MNDYNGIVIADIHLGAMDYNQTCKELEGLYKSIDKLGHLDYAIIAGDLFDKKLYSNDKFINLSQKFLIELIKRVKKIRLVEGTRSHDNHQYNIFDLIINGVTYKLYNENIDIKVVPTVADEYLFPDMKVLYVPEEYINNKNEYYKEFLEKENEYDYIFGHGVINEVMTYVKRASKTSFRRKAPSFTTKELQYPCKGQVFFGHYHMNTNIDDSVFYTGSYSRWRFGEESDKGFYHIQRVDGKYKSKFIKNSLALKYVTINYGYNNKIFSSDDSLIEELSEIKKKKEKKKIDYLRLIFNIPDDYEKSEFLINLLNERFKFDDDIKIEIVNGYISSKNKIKNERIKEVIDKYDIIFDKSQSDENKISFFIKEKNDKDIPADKISRYLKFKITDII